MDESLIVAIVMVTAAVIAFELRVSSAILEILAGIGLAFFFVDIAGFERLDFFRQSSARSLNVKKAGQSHHVRM